MTLRTQTRSTSTFARLMSTAAILGLAFAGPVAAQTEQSTEEKPAAEQQAAQPESQSETGAATEGTTDDSAETSTDQPEQSAEGADTTDDTADGATEQASDAAKDAADASTETDAAETGTAMPADDSAAMPQPDDADQQAAEAPADGQIVEQAPDTYQASDLIGADVNSTEGEHVGEITDILLDDQNKVTGYVISVGGFLGIGDREVGVSAESLSVVETPEGERHIVLAQTREQLENAPEFVTLEEQREAEEAERQARLAEQARQSANPLGTGVPATTPAQPSE